MNKYDIIIIGGGPAGLTASIFAAGRGKKVCIIEHNDRVGKKILSTGNGKCNITNMHIDSSCYHTDSNKSDFYKVIESFPPRKVIEFMNSIGLFTKNKNGYVYPNSEQASSVLDALRREAELTGVDIRSLTNVKSIKKDSTWHISTDKGQLNCDSLVIAAGSKAAPKTGSDGSGYKLAESLGHNIVPVIPALCPIICRDSFFREIQGVRADSLLTVFSDEREVTSERGELQLTSEGISGIPVFQLSSLIKRLSDSGNNVSVKIDFLPDTEFEELSRMIEKYACHNANSDLQSVLSGIINKKLAVLLAKESGLKPSMKCREADRTCSIKLSRIIKGLYVHPQSLKGFENAQSCAGGVDLDEIELTTMESKIQKRLFFAGEILDIDGRCGGYNLQWAWSSGRLAGISASEN